MFLIDITTDIDSGYDFVLSSNKSYIELMLTQLRNAIWRH